jgi:hypothetical protein
MHLIFNYAKMCRWFLFLIFSWRNAKLYTCWGPPGHSIHPYLSDKLCQPICEDWAEGEIPEAKSLLCPDKISYLRGGHLGLASRSWEWLLVNGKHTCSMPTSSILPTVWKRILTPAENIAPFLPWFQLRLWTLKSAKSYVPLYPMETKKITHLCCLKQLCLW